MIKKLIQNIQTRLAARRARRKVTRFLKDLKAFSDSTKKRPREIADI